MSELFRLTEVRSDPQGPSYSFTLHSGDVRCLALHSKAEKETMIDLMIGATEADAGCVEIAQDNRRRESLGALSPKEERRRHPENGASIWQSLPTCKRGLVGWVPSNGGLIGNLKIWENVTLPLWYHSPRKVLETEESVISWLTELGVDPAYFHQFMASSPDAIEPWRRKLAGLLRALVSSPRVMIVDAALFENIDEAVAQCWMAALNHYAHPGRAVLVLTDKITNLPWAMIGGGECELIS